MRLKEIGPIVPIEGESTNPACVFAHYNQLAGSAKRFLLKTLDTYYRQV
jgi:hypothetical protein